MSLVIGIRFLTNYCVAARSKTDPRPEWPLHPARLYMALAAAHFECWPEAAERAALDWLESLPPPVVHRGAEATMIDATPTFVPLNDAKSVGRGGSIQSLPLLKRHRAERLFPRTYLTENAAQMFVAWPTATDRDVVRHRPALDRLCSAVARLGHSSTLVQVWLADAVPDNLDTLVPVDDRHEHRLRVVARASGTIDRLAAAFTSPPYRYEWKASQGYARPTAVDAAPATTTFDSRPFLYELRAAKEAPRWLQLETTLALTATLRRAILAQCADPIPESISGHAGGGSGGGASDQPHMAFAPLAFVGGQYGDGHLLGVAVVVPRDMSERDRSVLATALAKIADEDADAAAARTQSRIGGLGFDEKQFPGLGQWRLVEVGAVDDPRVNLRASTWTAIDTEGARAWASVTPVVFDQHGKSRDKAAYLDECAASIATAAGRVVGGATVTDVAVTAIAPLQGVPPARDFPRLRRKDGSERRHMHAVITFDRPIVGPLLIGAGRYRGYGIFRPYRQGERS